MQTEWNLQNKDRPDLPPQPVPHLATQPEQAPSTRPGPQDCGTNPLVGKPASELTTHRARIAGPVMFSAGTGRKHKIPIGPCLVEGLGSRSIDIIWGQRGQRSVALPAKEIQAALCQGHLVMLD